MPDWGGLIMAQNCLIPKGPPKFDTVNVPPCKQDDANILQLILFKLEEVHPSANCYSQKQENKKKFEFHNP